MHLRLECCGKCICYVLAFVYHDEVIERAHEDNDRLCTGWDWTTVSTIDGDGGGAIFAVSASTNRNSGRVINLSVVPTTFVRNSVPGAVGEGNGIFCESWGRSCHFVLACSEPKTSGSAGCHDVKVPLFQGARQTCTPPSGTWNLITCDDFETWNDGSQGWGNFEKRSTGTTYATRIGRSRRGEESYIAQSHTAPRIRGKYGRSSSVRHRANHDVTAYFNLRVMFSFCARSMEDGESVVLEYSSTFDSADWTVMKVFVKGVNDDFVNGQCY